MRVNYFTVAGASLSIHLFVRSAIGVTDLRQRDGTTSIDRNVIRAGGSTGGSRSGEPELPKPIRPPEDSGAHSPASSNSNSNSNNIQEDPYYAPAPKPNSCLEQGSECLDIFDKASEFVKELAKALADAGGSTTMPSGTFATVITPAPMPNYDVIAAINMEGYLPLLNTAEQQMWRTDPLCFFANIEGYYAAAASKTPATSSFAAASTTPITASSADASTTPSVTSSASLLRRANPLDPIIQCEHSPYTGSACATPTSTLPPLSFSSVQSVFFSYYMPSVLISAYGAPRNGSLSTATTTCSGLHSSGSMTATYVMKAAAATTTTAPLAPQPSSGVRSGIRGWGPWKVLVAATGFLGAWVILLM